MFVDQIEHAVITNDPWQTADNYKADVAGIDIIEVAVAHRY